MLFALLCVFGTVGRFSGDEDDIWFAANYVEKWEEKVKIFYYLGTTNAPEYFPNEEIWSPVGQRRSLVRFFRLKTKYTQVSEIISEHISVYEMYENYFNDPDLQAYTFLNPQLEPAWIANVLFYLGEWMDKEMKKGGVDMDRLKRVGTLVFTAISNVGSLYDQGNIYIYAMTSVYNKVFDSNPKQVPQLLKFYARAFFANRLIEYLNQFDLIRKFIEPYDINLDRQELPCKGYRYHFYKHWLNPQVQEFLPDDLKKENVKYPWTALDELIGLSETEEELNGLSETEEELNGLSDPETNPKSRCRNGKFCIIQ
eukprot:NODE_452_length_7258_cov_0.721050.p4 type:complete len:312 gc:universal NODE_452_length_7258_cov_0.721050:4471-3536(-)